MPSRRKYDDDDDEEGYDCTSGPAFDGLHMCMYMWRTHVALCAISKSRTSQIFTADRQNALLLLADRTRLLTMMLVLLAQLSISFSPSLVSHQTTRPARRLPIGSRAPEIVACDLPAEFPEAIVESQKYKVQFNTTAGKFSVTLDRALSPLGVDRFVELVEDGHFTDQLFYRVLPGFLIQFGVAADPAQMAKWDWTPSPTGEKIWVNHPIADEPNREKFRAGTVSFAGNGENSRSCHFFIAMEPHGPKLGSAPHETTLGFVDQQTDEDGLGVMDRICRKFVAHGYIYADPDTGHLQNALIDYGNSAAAEYPLMDRIESAELVEC